MLSGTEFRAMFPGSQMDIKGALYTPADGRAEPQRAAPAIAEAARRKGAAVLTECAVRGIETSAGKVSGVVTERGRSPATRWCWQAAPGRACSPAITVSPSTAEGDEFGDPHQTLEGGPDRDLGKGFRGPQAQDGGYTIASGHENIVDIVPKASASLPIRTGSRSEWRSLRFRLGGRFFDETRIPARW